MADIQFLTLDAVDTLMFRDGRPFNQADAGASRAVSVFPPYPPTVVGAIRAALWKQLGSGWDKTKLGDGTDWQDDKTSLGPLRFGPPILIRESISGKNGRVSFEPVFPAPLHLVEGTRKNGVKAHTFLMPGNERHCDLGEKVRLPAPKEGLDGVKTTDGRWIILPGMKAVLDGRLPEEQQLIDRDELWQSEARVGIGISPDTRATNDGRLYMANHIRMADGVRLGVSLSGADRLSETLQPLAGEHRMAKIEGVSDQPVLPSFPKSLEGGRYCVVQTSPLVLNAMPGPGDKLGVMPGSLVSACLGKPVSVGGWNSTHKQPVPLRQAIPAGSVWFMQLDEGDAPDWQRCADGIGIATEWGFGQYLIGKW